MIKNGNKRLNVTLTKLAHKIIERYKLDHDLQTKDEAVEQIILNVK